MTVAGVFSDRSVTGKIDETKKEYETRKNMNRAILIKVQSCVCCDLMYQ